MKTQRYWLAAAVLLALTAASTPFGRASAEAVKGSMATGGRASPPAAHKEFCRQHRSECRPLFGSHSLFRMSKQGMAMLKSVNSVVNRVVKSRSDLEAHGTKDFWSYPVSGYGDCEDLVLLKRKILNHSGIPLSNLLVTVVSHDGGKGHAVLTVRTDRGDLVLDSLNNDVKPWRETGYRFHKRQSSAHAGRWVEIAGGGGEVVSSR